jgi:seryl-tRNA synthetase
MSGSKATYVTMEQRRAQRLLEMETHFRAVQQDLPERLRELRQEMQTELGSQRRRMDQRWREMQAVTKNLSKEIAAVER